MVFRKYFDPVERKGLEKAKKRMLFSCRFLLFFGPFTLLCMVLAFVFCCSRDVNEGIRDIIIALTKISALAYVSFIVALCLEARKFLKILEA